MRVVLSKAFVSMHSHCNTHFYIEGPLKCKEFLFVVEDGG